MAPITVTLTHAKSTKGTHVYAGDTIPTIYVPKSVLPNPPPQTITVTIQES